MHSWQVPNEYLLKTCCSRNTGRTRAKWKADKVLQARWLVTRVLHALEHAIKWSASPFWKVLPLHGFTWSSSNSLLRGKSCKLSFNKNSWGDSHPVEWSGSPLVPARGWRIKVLTLAPGLHFCFPPLRLPFPLHSSPVILPSLQLLVRGVLTLGSSLLRRCMWHFIHCRLIYGWPFHPSCRDLVCHLHWEFLEGQGVTWDLSVCPACDPHTQLLFFERMSHFAPEGRDSGCCVHHCT